jgi:microcystin-dependent protein
MDGIIGFIALFAGNFAPKGWAFCSGQIMRITQYPALFQILGNVYGGDGKTTFALPNLQGRAVVSAGQAPGMLNYAFGQPGGAEVCTMLINQMPAHTHALEVQLTPYSNGTVNSASPQNANYATGANNLYNYTGNTPLQAYEGSLTIADTGYDPKNTPTAIPYLHPVLGMNYIICLNGQMPGDD